MPLGLLWLAPTGHNDHTVDKLFPIRAYLASVQLRLWADVSRFLRMTINPSATSVLSFRGSLALLFETGVGMTRRSHALLQPLVLVVARTWERRIPSQGQPSSPKRLQAEVCFLRGIMVDVDQKERYVGDEAQNNRGVAM